VVARDGHRVFVDSVLIRLAQAKSNQQLSLALQQAQAAMQSRTRFLASASHDLRQPMHTLSLFGSALVRRPLDAATSSDSRYAVVPLAAAIRMTTTAEAIHRRFTGSPRIIINGVDPWAHPDAKPAMSPATYVDFTSASSPAKIGKPREQPTTRSSQSAPEWETWATENARCIGSRA